MFANLRRLLPTEELRAARGSNLAQARGPVWPTGLPLALGMVALLFLTVAPAASATSDSPETVVRAWIEAVNRGDTEAAISLYADEAVIVALGQEIRGKAAIAQRQRTIIGPVLRPAVSLESIATAGDTVTVRLLGENAITRFDGHGPVRAVTSFVVRDGMIQRETGPVLAPADAAWYADASRRFRATGALPGTLPRAGAPAEATERVEMLAAAVLGMSVLGLGFALRRRGAGRPILVGQVTDEH